MPPHSSLLTTLPHFPTNTVFYAVRNGRIPGVYLSPEGCNSQVWRKRGCWFKKFSDPEVACAFVWGEQWENRRPWHFSVVNSAFEEAGLGVEIFGALESRDPQVLAELPAKCRQAARSGNPAQNPHAEESTAFFLRLQQALHQVPPPAFVDPDPILPPPVAPPTDARPREGPELPSTLAMPIPDGVEAFTAAEDSHSTSSSSPPSGYTDQLEDLSQLMSMISTTAGEGSDQDGFSIITNTTSISTTTSTANSRRSSIHNPIQPSRRTLRTHPYLRINHSLTATLPDAVTVYLLAARYDSPAEDIVAAAYADAMHTGSGGTPTGTRHLLCFLSTMEEVGMDMDEAITVFNLFQED